MKIKRLLLNSVVAFCVVSFSPGVLHASNASRLYVTTPGVSFALATSDGASGSTFVWSQVSPTVGAKLKVLEVVSSPLKGTPTYRASGVCSLRKGVLSFSRVGKCRVSVAVKMKNTGKVLRSSKVFVVSAKTLSVPQMQLTGTSQEQLMQVVRAIEQKVAVFRLVSREWNVSLHQLNLSLVSYGIRVKFDPNEEGRNIYQISMGGQSVCFLWSTNPDTLAKYLKSHSCAKIG
jgi:hypothetical protein